MYKVTEVAATVCRLVLKEQRTRLATPSESGQPTAYGEQIFLAAEHTCANLGPPFHAQLLSIVSFHSLD